MMHRALLSCLVLVMLCLSKPSTSAAAAPGGPRPVGSPAPTSAGAERVYEVHKKVSDFPDREDLSTPEAAYATIHRAYAAEGDAAWLRLSAPKTLRRASRN